MLLVSGGLTCSGGGRGGNVNVDNAAVYLSLKSFVDGKSVVGLDMEVSLLLLMVLDGMLVMFSGPVEM